MISYYRILYELAMKISVPKQGLYALADNKSTIQRKLNEAKRRGHVKETKCEYRRKGTRNLIVPIITITKEGLAYLCNKGYKDIPWLEYVDEAVDVSSIVPSGIMTKEEMLKRYYRVSLPALMNDLVGGQECVISILKNEQALERGNDQDEKEQALISNKNADGQSEQNDEGLLCGQ